jgi:RNA polymerase sigma factor (sigma-70 family)
VAAVEEKDVSQRLSNIATRWSLVWQAHHGQGDAVSVAQRRLLQRYCGAVYRYLLGALRDTDAADELAQEFALRFVRGDFKRADPERGRFRDFVKTAVYHLIVDYHRRRQGRPMPLPSESCQDPAAAPDGGLADQEFLDRWREELLDRTWEALAEVQERTGQLFHRVLLWRTEHPQEPAARLAEQLTAQHGRAFTEAGIRQTLHRAREKFADLLLDEVARSLQTTAPDRVEQELIDLGLLPYCRPALERRRKADGKQGPSV